MSSSSTNNNSPSHGRLRLLATERMLTSPLADLKRRSRQRRQQQPLHHPKQPQGDEEDDEDSFIRRLDEQQQYSVEEEEIDWNKPTRFSANSHHRHRNLSNIHLNWQHGMGRPYRSAVLLPQGDESNHEYLEEDEETEEYYDARNTTTALDDNFILRKPTMDNVRGNGESSRASPWAYSSRHSSLSRSSGYLLGLPPRIVTNSSSALVAKRASLSYHHIKNEQRQQQDSWDHQQPEQQQQQQLGPNPSTYSGSSSGCSTQSSCSSFYGSSLRSQLHSQHQQQTTSGSSLQAAANNFRTFVENYERGLIQCLSSVSDQQQQHQQQPEKSNSWTGSMSVMSTSSPARQRHNANGGGGSLSIITDHEDADDEDNDQDDERQHNNLHLMSNEESTDPTTSTSTAFTTSSASPQLYHSLRLQLAKVRALREQYETGVKCTEALEKLMKLNKSRDCDRQLRSHERQLIDIERQLEAMIGRFAILVEDLEGWARICPRDHYEIEFKHGKQRRVLHLRIGKKLERVWQEGVQEVSFEGKLKPNIGCRLKEIKSGWRIGRRTVTLGSIDINMGEMLVSVSRQQSMLLNVNTSGSLKMRIRCAWQPTQFDGQEGHTLPSTSSERTKSSSSRSGGDAKYPKANSLPIGYRPQPTNLLVSTSFSGSRGNFGSNLTSNYHLARSLMALPTMSKEVGPTSVDDNEYDDDDDLDDGDNTNDSAKFSRFRNKPCLY